MASSTNRSINKAQEEKNDEFYTRLEDIENELRHYEHHFRDKVVLCNCDDPRESNFFHYFFQNFKYLGLRKLIATCYKNQQWDLFSTKECEDAVYIVYDGPSDNCPEPREEDLRVMPLKGDGDFRSKECLMFLEDADIVVTNPPFSLFREFISIMEKYNKKYIILGNPGAVTYKETFKLIRENKLWFGVTRPNKFTVSEDYKRKLMSTKEEGKGYKIVNGEVLGIVNSAWFTNLTHNATKEPVILTEKYNPEKYHRYENFDAINVDKVSDIPVDYFGVIGVPTSFMDKYNPNACKRNDGKITTNDFDIISSTSRGGDGLIEHIKLPYKQHQQAVVNGAKVYVRLFIKRKQ